MFQTKYHCGLHAGEELDNPASPYYQLLLPMEKAFVKKCLAKDVALRPTPASLIQEDYMHRAKPLS